MLLASCKVLLASCKVPLASCKVPLASCKVGLASCKAHLRMSDQRCPLPYISFPDENLWLDLRQGFRPTGWVRERGLFTSKSKPPVASLEQLLSQAAVCPGSGTCLLVEQHHFWKYCCWKCFSAEIKTQFERYWILEGSSMDPCCRIVLVCIFCSVCFSRWIIVQFVKFTFYIVCFFLFGCFFLLCSVSDLHI